MRDSQIEILTLVVGALLFALVGIEMEQLKRNISKLSIALRETLFELDRIFKGEK